MVAGGVAGGVEEEDGLAAMRLTRSSIVVTSYTYIAREKRGRGRGSGEGERVGRGKGIRFKLLWSPLFDLYIVFFALSPSLPLSRLYLLAYQFGSSLGGEDSGW